MSAVQDLLTLYESIGGAESVASIVEDFYERVLGDPAVAPFFEGVDMAALMAHQQAFLSAAFEGPQLYQGKPLREAHATLHIGHDQFERLTQHLFETLRGFGADDAHVRMLEARVNAFRGDIVTST